MNQKHKGEPHHQHKGEPYHKPKHMMQFEGSSVSKVKTQQGHTGSTEHKDLS
jgi:hypothetical protein